MPKPKLPDRDFDWSPQLAYAVGLISTDGSLSSDGRHIILTSSDKNLLRTFKNCLGLENKITINPPGSYSNKHIYRIQFGDIQFYKWLIKIGLSTKKTYTIAQLDISDRFFPDFLRGHLDGDGNILTYTDFYNTAKNPKYVYHRLFTRFLSASETHILWLQQTIERLLQIHGSITSHKPWRKDQSAIMWELKYAKKESIKLLSWIYYSPNVPCLERKQRIAEPFLVRCLSKQGSKNSIRLSLPSR